MFYLATTSHGEHTMKSYSKKVLIIFCCVAVSPLYTEANVRH